MTNGRSILVASMLLAGLTPVVFGNAPPPAVSPAALTAGEKAELLRAREAVWRAWFENARDRLQELLPEETLAINAGEEEWKGRTAISADAQAFAARGGKLIRLEFPRTEIQVYGDVAILYSLYRLETEADGRRETSSGRATEVFVRRSGRWLNPGWHLDSGR